ncbi:MAG: prephenate dehydratase [Thermodesulfobacteriota bacterium]
MKKDTTLTLADVRKEIDSIDTQVLTLLKQRLGCAKKIGELKAQDNNRAKWDPLRERQIVERLLAENQGTFPELPLRSIFHEIINTCRISQKKEKVAYLGPEGTYSHLAVIKHFGHAADFVPVETIEDVFTEVERGRVQYGMVPVENSIEGAVTPALDAIITFSEHRVMICGELNLVITHNLVNQSGEMEDIQEVVSHAQPLAQCRKWLKKNLPNAHTRVVESTGAAALLAAEDPSIAAIASSLAIKTYRLRSVASGIEDYSNNITRFLIIGKESPHRSGRDKTSLLVGLLDRPGALHDALNLLAQREINLTRIESRPVKDKPGRYLFFIDMLGHMEDETVRDGYDRLKEICSPCEWLGSYPITGA